MIDEIQDIFPKLSSKQIWRLLITIKQRYKKYITIGISRLESTRFGISERQMQSFIYYLRNIGAINKKKMVKGRNNCFKCNIYSLSGWFVEQIEKVKDFVKKVFEYIDPKQYMLSKFPVIRNKYGKLEFRVNGNKYIIHKRGRYKGKIYGVEENKIINPLELGKKK